MEIIEDKIPRFDIPDDFLVGSDISGEILKLYGNFPCKMQAGVFVLCLKGHISSSINLSEYTVSENDFAILPPGTFIQIHDISDDISLCFAVFSSKFANSTDIFPVMMENPVINITREQADLFHDFFKILIKAKYCTESFINKEIVRSMINFFRQCITTLYNNESDTGRNVRTRDYEIHREFTKLVLENYNKHHNVSFYAEKLGITLQHFCNTIKKATGTTALNIINSIIIMDAKAQLRSTDLPVKRIAAGLGFTNQAFFNKYFKQHVEMTPVEYRNNKPY